MLVMIDDVQFESKERFFKYINKALGCEDNEINSADTLLDVLCCFEDDIELTFYDTEEIPQDMKLFAEEIFGAVYNAKSGNDRLSVKFAKTSV